MVSIAFPEAEREAGGGFVAEIIDIDHFGNARLAAMQDDLDLQNGVSLGKRRWYLLPALAHGAGS
jgi:hypothetical protein